MNIDCAFCSDQIRKRVIDEGTFSIVVLSSPRITPGHLLIIPKRHVQKFSDLKIKESKEILMLLSKYQEKILNNLSKGTEVRQNFRPDKKDSNTHVNHFHFNIFPRNKDDEIESKVDVYRRSMYKDLSEKERRKILKLLKIN